MIAAGRKGHIGGALSCTDILVSLYYGGIFNFAPQPDRQGEADRFVLSKGHSCASLYAVLSDLGFFSPDELGQYQKKGCLLGGHPSRKIPGIEADTGSLGHGPGIAAGLAWAGRLDKKDFVTAVLLGDGECCEGSVWEAAAFAAHHKLDNLLGIIDRNRICSTDFLRDCFTVDPLEDKWRAFGWEVRIVDGHSIEELLDAFSYFRTRRNSNSPLMIMADTVKGKGVSFMQDNPGWHHAVPNDEQCALAREELCDDEDIRS